MKSKILFFIDSEQHRMTNALINSDTSTRMRFDSVHSQVLIHWHIQKLGAFVSLPVAWQACTTLSNWERLLRTFETVAKLFQSMSCSSNMTMSQTWYRSLKGLGWESLYDMLVSIDGHPIVQLWTNMPSCDKKGDDNCLNAHQEAVFGGQQESFLP